MPPPPDTSATMPSGPVKTRIDAIEPEAGPTTGNYKIPLKLLKVKPEYSLEEVILGKLIKWKFIKLNIW